MTYRTTVKELFEILGVWDPLIGGRGSIHLIACGGTVLTLLGYKESTKDVDFLVPVEKEYRRLIDFLKRAGYQETAGTHGWLRPGENLVFDLFPGKRVYTTELLTSPIAKGGHQKIKQWKKIYLGMLNPIDWIISKLFRGSAVDREDCLTLVEHEEIDFERLKKRFRETASYDTSEERVLKNLDWFLRELRRHA